MTRGRLAGYKGKTDCGACSARTRLGRQCDKPFARPPRWGDDQWAAWQIAAAKHAGPSTCPVRKVETHPLGAWVVDVLVDARQCTGGVLLKAGGIEDQPARWWEAIHVAQVEMARCDAEARDDKP